MEPKLGTVLVVEDEAHDRLLMQELLSAEGLTAIVVEDGAAALAAVAERLPDLVVLDILLPGGIDGFEVARRLKSDPRTRNIPILIATAMNDRESRLQGLDLGVEEFICKPVDRAELSARVRNLLRLKEYQDFLADHNRILEEQVSERTATLAAEVVERKQAEEALRQQTDELRARNEELTRFNRATAGRELRMIELKQEVNDLAAELGRPRPYALAFIDAAAEKVVSGGRIQEAGGRRRNEDGSDEI